MLDGENSLVVVDSVSMIVIRFLCDRVADDLPWLRSRERLRSDGLSLRRRGSSWGMSLLTGVLVRELDLTTRCFDGEVVGDD